MDLATFIGFVAVWGMVGWSVASTGNLNGFIDIASFVMVAGGTLGATMASYTLPQTLNAVRVASKAFFTKKQDTLEVIETLRNAAEVARREGIIALENLVDEIDDEFMKTGLQLIADGVDTDGLVDTLETKLAYLEQRHEQGQSIFRTAATYAPSFGMIGTLVGLIDMLGKLSDPGALGPGMSLALVTTFYGSVLSNMVFSPIAAKLEVRTQEEVLNKEIIIRGLVAIQQGENPRVVQKKLLNFLPVKQRGEMATSRSEEA